jgi:uncharacterized metal-binding protein YceD (DUF177 family)
MASSETTHPNQSGSIARVLLSSLQKNGTAKIDYAPQQDPLKNLARELGFIGLRKVRLQGELVPSGTAKWEMNASLGATIIQASSVSLEPVTTRIDEKISRVFARLEDAPDLEEETEVSSDAEIDYVEREIDLRFVIAEYLAICAPDYPRNKDEDFLSAQFSAPGVDVMTDADASPFAGLAKLQENRGK